MLGESVWDRKQMHAHAAAKSAADNKALRDALLDALDFLERHSNRWDGVNGKHPHEVVEAARAALKGTAP
jgi:hypothetical protein